jgi:asparagine synthetase B (glutamine-hydrolysing)
MSDFYLDFRPSQERDSDRAASFLRFFPDIQVVRIEETGFSLVLTRCDDLKIWGPYRSIDNKIFVALAGRIALESEDWENAKHLPGNGGLVCKAIYELYKGHGISGLRELNGSFIVMVFDNELKQFFIISDRSGMFPFFRLISKKGPPLFSSHPDLLASLSQASGGYDLTSLAEFAMTGQITYPNTYHQGVKAAEFASIHTIDLKGVSPSYQGSEQYFHLNYKPEDSGSRLDLSERLAGAFKNAMRRRTYSQLGTSAIGLSGGLDSRMILCACPDPSQIRAYCFYDEENLEYNTSQKIADAMGIKLIPFKREFEYYGNSAEAGVRISGGMSSFLTNHLLGFRKRLREEGFDNILTGLYCDYFFKGLAQNRRRTIFSREEAPAAFNLDWYLHHFPLQTDEGIKVNQRLENTFPLSLRRDTSDSGRLEVERKRLFPLCYEPENAEVLIPQRIIGWYMPILDNEVLDVYLTVPIRFKFDHAMYAKVLEIICGKKICSITDSNTGAQVNASSVRQFFQTYSNIIRNRYKRRFSSPGLATSGSWPNWEYYLHHSQVIRELWTRKNDEVRDLFDHLLGYDPFQKPIQEFRGKESVLFERLLTLKVWFSLSREI